VPTINVYIDGFNLYYGCLKDTPYRWLDLARFSRALVPNRYSVEKIKYYTARVIPLPQDPGANTRQDFYLRAIATIPNCSVTYGYFLTSTVKMPLAKPKPGGAAMARVIKTEEKGSDVNLACHLVADAFENTCDAVFVISNDSDLLEPIRIARRRLGMTVGLATPFRPPGRPANVLINEADFRRPIRRGTLAKSQFPATLTDTKGSFSKPPTW
jgi:uncharacterized LabA/DUF88 family protein